MRSPTRSDEFAALFRRTQPLVAWFVRTTFPGADTDEIVAETFLTAWERFDAIPDGREVSWLLTTARNHWRNRARRSRNADKMLATIAGTTPMATPEPSLDHEIDPMLRAAMAGLTEDEREIIVLRVVVGLEPHELARIVGVSSGAARVRLHRATAKLRANFEALEREQSEGGEHGVA